jgi:hypothetical protein
MKKMDVSVELVDYLDVLRIDEATWRTLVMECQRRSSAKHRDKRSSQRDPLWSPLSLGIAVTHPGGNIARFLVRPHNISEGGFAFFHGQFLHLNTPLESELPIDGIKRLVQGHVTFCRLIRGRIHEVGVMFDKPTQARTEDSPE